MNERGEVSGVEDAGLGKSVLLVLHEATLSGAPLQLLHLARWLHGKGWRLSALAAQEGPILDELRDAGVAVAVVGGLFNGTDYGEIRPFVRGLAAVVVNTLAPWQAVCAAHAENVPVIWYLHETLVGRVLMAQIPEIRPALALASALVAPTRTTACVYEPFTRREISVVPYGIPSPLTQENRTPSASLKFLTLGSYEPRKGQDILLAASEILSSEDATFTGFIDMAGRILDQSFYEALRRRSDQVRFVKLLGLLDHGAAQRLLSDADVLICPSRDETMPIVVLEAMSLGKAVICGDVGGIHEWLHDGVNAILVPAEDAGALAAAIQRCASEPGLVAKLGGAARRTFERHFTLDRYGADFARVLEAAITAGGGPAATRDRSYQRWVEIYDTFLPADAVDLQRKLRELRSQPQISVILPVYNPDLDLLEAAIASVAQQVYQRWELCIADDASTIPGVRACLESQAAADPRIKLVFREANGHIAACSNSALALATGEWCALLDQDDTLAPPALAEMALEMAAHPDAGLLYSDEDKIDLAGARSNPFFKPDWNPELFLGQNYINHLGLYRMSVVRAIGGFRLGVEGSQDYDLALRCVERLQPHQIRHLPRILYHWRMAPGSLASVADAKPYAREAARRALSAHLQRMEISGRVAACPENSESHRVIYELPDPLPLVSIIIPMRDRVELLQKCIQSLKTLTDYDPFEILIVDNGSLKNETLNYLRKISLEPNVIVIRDESPFNFSRLNNLAVKQAAGSLIVFLNSDIEITDSDWLREMVSHASRPRVGAVGARLWYPDGTLQHGGVVLGLGGVAGHAHHRVPRGHPGYFNRAWLLQNCSAVTAACLATRREVFEMLGGFDEKNLAVNFNDIDFCLRVRRSGWEVVWTPYADLVHRESASRGHHPTSGQQALFMREAGYLQQAWGTELLHDPFYSPNLSLSLPGFQLSFPPRRGG